MILIKRTLPTPQENLAWDESLVEVADRISSELSSSASFPEVLRLWEMPSPCVVLGRASQVGLEVNLPNCERDRVPVLRRVSGGASVVAGPGCLMYSVLVSYDSRPSWKMLDAAHLEVMSRIQLAVQRTLDAFSIGKKVELNGTCDLTIDQRKFSGNALRCKRNWMLYHGTILVSMPLPWLSDYLQEPPRQPEYRQLRAHDDFITRLWESNAPVSPNGLRIELEQQMAKAWDAVATNASHPYLHEFELEAEQLLQRRYSKQEWHNYR